MSTVNEPIRFGDVIKLQTTSAFADTASLAYLGFLELPGKAQTQLLVVPPVKADSKDRFVEAEFIIAPIRSEKEQANGTPLTCQTPFVLRTSDGKDGSTYSLNNKITGQRDAIGLQVSATKGEMHIQVEKDGCTNETGLNYGDDSLNLHVVDSNRVRKSFNNVLTHIAKPKSDAPGGMVTCSAKGSTLVFSFHRAVDKEGNFLTETHRYIKNPQARRFSLEALGLGLGLGPAKMDELGRADRIDSSEFSDVDAMSRSSSVATLNSNPASPRGASTHNATTTPIDAAAVIARLPKTDEGLETETTVSTAASSHTSSQPEPANVAEKTVTTTQTSIKATLFAKTSVKNEIAKIEASKAEAMNAETTKTESAKSELARTEAAKSELARTKQANRAVKTEAASPQAPAAPVAKAATSEPMTVLADASTFPPMPVINGPAPAPVVVSPKAAGGPQTSAKAATTPTAAPTSPRKFMKEEEVVKLKAEAEAENLEPACGATCSVM